MQKTLLIIENNPSLKEHDLYYVFRFLETWDGDVIDFSGFHQKSKQDIFTAVMRCTDIICQTALVNGSELQFESMIHLMAKIKEPKNIHLAFLGGSLFDYMDSYFTDEELLSIRHHNIYEMGIEETKAINFNERIEAHLNKQAADRAYRDAGNNRKTGRKVKIIACNASGKAFQGLPIGETVDELDMSEQEPNSNRGVWIWGNGEPVKLVNDCGLAEYRVVSELSAEEKMIEIFKTIGVKQSDYSNLILDGIVSTIKSEEIATMSKANYLCEELNIEKRRNRSLIANIL